MKLSVKNMPLVIVLSLTVLISLVLIYFVIIKHAQVSETNAKIEEYKGILENANRKKPAPVTENFKNMTIDVDKLTLKSYQIQRTFGKYYRKALIEFANTVGISGNDLTEAFKKYYANSPDDAKADIVGSKDKTLIDSFLSGKDKAKLEAAIAAYGTHINESTLLKDFAAFYKDLPDAKKGQITGGNSDKAILKEFFEKQKYGKALLESATDKFMKDIQLLTVEPITKDNVHEFLLAALGLPRTAFVTYYKGMLRNLQNQMFRKKLLPAAETIKDVEALTYGEDFQPNQKQIPLVIRQMLLREDLFNRAKTAKIASFVELKELTTPLKEQIVSDDYVKYSYSAVLEGTMDDLRQFINLLQNAYKDNVVYKIKDISLIRTIPENITELTSLESKDQTILLAARYQFPDFAAEKTENNLLAASYGKPVVGRSKLVTLKLTFDILLYVADELKRVDSSTK